MGYFKNTTVWGGGGGHYGPPCNFVLLKVKGQNLVTWAILMCFLQKLH